MVAFGRALMSSPKLIIMDEPSMGLSPALVSQNFDIIKRINTEENVTVFIVEQNARAALSIADRGYVLETGHVALHGAGADLLHNEQVRKTYLGES